MMPSLQGILCCVQNKLQALTENGETTCLLPTTAKPQPELTSSKFLPSSHMGSDSILQSPCHFCIPFDGKQLGRTEECCLSGKLRHPDSMARSARPFPPVPQGSKGSKPQGPVWKK